MRLVDVALVVRSKNAGPYELTLDVVFADPAAFERHAPAITAERVAATYGVPLPDVLERVPFPAANALKVTLRRPLPAGAVGDADVYGAQQHVPLCELEL